MSNESTVQGPVTAIAIDMPTALAAAQAIGERLQLMRARAAVDARYLPEVERLVGARAALDRAINASLTLSTSQPTR